jgi:signal transduction histidine kinase
VFIVEDDELLRGGLGRGLRRRGFDVCGEASSGEAALEQIPSVAPDIIVMDVGLSSSISGVEVAERLRAIVDIPIVFMTGSTDTVVAKLAAETGSFGYVIKPVTAEVLAANLEMAAVRHAADARLRRAREELERVNAKLEASEQRYRSLCEQAIEGMFQVTLDGAIVEANPAFARLVGYDTPEELLGSSLHSLAVSPHDEQRLRAMWTGGDAVDGQDQRPAGSTAAWRCGSIDGIELFWRTRGGSAITVELHGRVLPDQLFHGFVRDVTEIRERQRAERVALEANRAKTHFVVSMSHELRTPLNAVLGLSDALLARTYGALTDGQQRALQTIHASGRHLLDLINDVLDVACIEAGRLPIDVRDIGLASSVGECIALVIEQAEAKRQRLTTELDPTIDAVRADARRLKQVLINLLTNAIKFTPDGGAITVRARRSDHGFVELAVCDNGPGIAEIDRERVFEPFVTLDPFSRSSSGLGLALVKRIVELQGGSVRLESEPGGGSRFIVTVHQAHTRPDVASPREDLSNGSGRG